MKKFLFCMAIGAILLSSCSSDETVIATDGGNVTFRATLPEGIMSRSSYDDGLTATNLEYAVYDAEGKNIAALNGTTTLVSRAATVGLNLVTGKTYTVVFWASAEGAPYAFDATEGKMTVTPTGDANDVKRDAFFATEKFTVTGAVSKTIELRRPFAQINIGTSDLADFTAAGGNISKSGITVTAAKTLNLLDGTVDGEVEYVLEPAAHVTDVAYNVPSADKQLLLTTNFILVDRAKSTVDITWTSDNDTPGREKVVYTHVPVQRNYRTNIYGKLLTNPSNYEVVVNPEFETEPGYDYDVDGAICARNEDNTVECITPALPVGVTPESFTTQSAGVVCLDEDGVAKYFPATSKGLLDAMAISDEIYLAPNTEITMTSHQAKIPATGIKIYGNGSTLNGQECDFSLDYTEFTQGSTVDIYIENLNNARIWGDAKVACTLNVTLNNCTFIGKGYGGDKYSLGLIMMRGTSVATHNIVIKDCYCEGVQVGMHSANAGSFTIIDSTFKGVGIPVNIAKKSSEKGTVTIEGCSFVGCGLPEDGPDKAWDYAAPIRVVDNQGPANSLTVKISDTSVVDRIGSYDVLLTDYRADKTSYSVVYDITNSGDLVVRDK